MATTKHEPPKGFSNANIELAGFWAPEEGPIQGRLIGGFRFRNSLRRTTIVYVIALEHECVARAKLEGGGFELTVLAPGEVCGVFHSGGLTRLQSLYGASVWLAPDYDDDGEWRTKTLEQGEMKLYRIEKKGKGAKLPIEDRQSQETPNHSGPVDYPDDSDDSLPF